MMRRFVTFADLDRLLLGAGFDVERPAPTHILYSYPNANVVILLPPRSPDDTAEPFHVASVRRTLVDHGLLTEDDFEDWLCGLRAKSKQRGSTLAGVTNGLVSGTD